MKLLVKKLFELEKVNSKTILMNNKMYEKLYIVVLCILIMVYRIIPGFGCHSNCNIYINYILRHNFYTLLIIIALWYNLGDVVLSFH